MFKGKSIFWGIFLFIIHSSVYADLSGEVAIVSDYRLYGFSQSQEKPALQGELMYGISDGLSFGAFVSNTDLVDDDDPGDLGADIELDVFVTLEFPVNKVDDFAITYISYNWPDTHSGVDIDYNEFIFDLILEEGGTFTVGYSTDAFATSEDAARYEYNHTIQLGKSDFSVNVQLGYYDLDDALGESYMYYTVGMNYLAGPINLNLSINGSTSGAEKLFGPVADTALVFSASYAF